MRLKKIILQSIYLIIQIALLVCVFQSILTMAKSDDAGFHALGTALLSMLILKINTAIFSLYRENKKN